MTKSITILSATGAALLASLGRQPQTIGEHTAYVTGSKTLTVMVQARARVPRGQARQLQFRAFGMVQDKKGAHTLCAGAWQATENEALRSLQVDFEQCNQTAMTNQISADMYAQGALSIPDAGRVVDYRDPPLLEDQIAA